jgi:Glycine zipper 2TM domain
MKKIIKMLWIASLIGVSASVLGSDNELGTVVGGVAGGIIGHNMAHGADRTAATIGGAAVGSLVGNHLGDNTRHHYRDEHCYPEHPHWEPHHYPMRYPNSFIGHGGRLCRRAFIYEYGNRIPVTFYCHRMTPDGYCLRWVRID